MLEYGGPMGLTVRVSGSLRYPGQFSSLGFPSMLKILPIWSISPRPWKRAVFCISSAKMQPTDHMSTAVLYSLAPSSNSGLLDYKGGASVEPEKKSKRTFLVRTYRYHSVTTNCVISPNGSPNFLANPKSATLICPLLFISRLDVLRSR